MKRLLKFLSLTGGERLLLIKAAILLALIRVGLKLLPFQILRSLMARVSARNTDVQEVNQTYLDRVVWAVLSASNYVPGVKCLARSLAIQVLLTRRGYPAFLRIGVAKDEQKELLAHAWVEMNGQVVGGLAQPSSYSLLPPL